MAASDFWQDARKAAEITRERSRLVGIVERVTEFESEVSESKDLAELAAEEDDTDVLADVEKQLDAMTERMSKLEFERMLSEEQDFSDAIVSINAGAGGTEAQDWAEMLFRMYLRWTEREGFKAEIVDQQPGDEAGIKSVTMTVHGPYAYGYLSAETGVHRLVRISPFDAAKRRHTSFASVFVFPEIDDDVEVEIDEGDIRIDTYRSSGAGGQHVNVTDSAVRITHAPSGIVVQCQNERSQHKNKATAMKLLRARLYQYELEKRAQEKEDMAAEKKKIEWGSQIRSYVLHPYRMVKDHRTNMEVGNADGVLDGDLTKLMETYLLEARGN